MFAATESRAAEPEIATWTGSGNWTDTAKWTPAADPNSNVADVYVNSGSGVLNLNDWERTVGRLTIGEGDRVNLQSGQKLRMGSSGFDGAGTLNNDGVLAMNGSALELGNASDQTISFTGSGKLEASNTLNTIHAQHSGMTLEISSGFSVEGALNFTGWRHLQNSGTIRSTGNYGTTLAVSGTLTNQGSIEAAAGSQITVGGGTYANTEGVMAANGAGAVLLFNGSSTLQGGTLSGLNGGIVRLQSDSARFEDVTFDGASEIANSYYPMFSGTTTINGVMTAGTSSFMKFGAASDDFAILAGTGKLILNDATLGAAAGGSIFTGVTLTNEIALEGRGNLGSGQLKNLINTGSIVAKTGAIYLQLAGSGTFNNQGTVRAEADSSLHFTSSGGTYVNTGQTMSADGAGAKLVFNAAGKVVGGTLEGVNGGLVSLNSDYIRFEGVTFNGASEIASGYFPMFSGTTTINGVMTGYANSSMKFGAANDDLAILTGTGEVILNNTTLGAAVGGSTFTGVTLTNEIALEGNGSIGGGTLQHVVNKGSIVATSGTLALQPASGGTFTNQGTIQAEAGAVIDFNGSGASYVNTGSTITADGAGAELRFVSANRVVGGTLSAINGAEVFIQSDSAVFQNVTFEGAGRIANGYYPIFSGGTTFNGVMTAGNNALLRFGEANGATETLYGSGSLVLEGATVTSKFADVNFINRGNITGFGNLGGSVLKTITNYGTLKATGPAGLAVSLLSAAAFSNQGVVEADDSTFTVGTNWLKSANYTANTHSSQGTLSGGTWVASGTGKIDVTTTSTPSAYQIHTNAATVTLSGTGASITGFSGYVQENTGTLRLLDGHQFTNGAGVFTNKGTFEIGAGSRLTADYSAQAGSFTILDGELYGQAHIAGTFEGSGTVTGDLIVDGGAVAPGSGGGTGSLTLGSGFNYTQNDGTLLLQVARLGGNLAQDRINAYEGAISLTDTTIVLSLGMGSQMLQVGDTFTVLQANFSNGEADLTLAGVDYTFDTSLSNYTFDITVGDDALSFKVLTVTTIPEPGTYALLGIGLAALAYLRRKRQ